MKKNKRIFIVSGVVVLLAVAAVMVFLLKDVIFSEKVDGDFTVSYDGIETGIVNARVSVHDPSIIKADGTYYIFGSHMEGGLQYGSAFLDETGQWL